MAATVTVTGVIGPDTTLTAKVFTEVAQFSVNALTNVLSLFYPDGTAQYISVNAATTVTSTKSGLTWTLVIS